MGARLKPKTQVKSAIEAKTDRNLQQKFISAQDDYKRGETQ
jgi:hypothetical protein